MGNAEAQPFWKQSGWGLKSASPWKVVEEYWYIYKQNELLVSGEWKCSSLFPGRPPFLHSGCTAKLVNCTLRSNPCGVGRSRPPVTYSFWCQALCGKLATSFVKENDIKMFFLFCLGTFWMNPQYWLNVLPVEDSKKSLCSCNVVISMMQKHTSKHRNRAPHLFIGFSLYKVWRIALTFLLSPSRDTSSPLKLDSFADQEFCCVQGDLCHFRIIE